MTSAASFFAGLADTGHRTTGYDTESQGAETGSLAIEHNEMSRIGAMHLLRPNQKLATSLDLSWRDNLSAIRAMDSEFVGFLTFWPFYANLNKTEPPRMALGDCSSQRRSGVLFFV